MYGSLDIINMIISRKMIASACRMHGRHKKCIRNFSRKTRRKICTGKARRRREDEVEMDLREIIWMNRVHLTQAKET